jgi:hypothetical protein
LRDLTTGGERRLFINQSSVVSFDWDVTSTTLFFDNNCQLWSMDTNGVVTPLPMSNDCYDDAPIQNPSDGRLAFHNLNGNTSIKGLYVTSPDRTTKQRLNLNVVGASWPGWSPDGQLLVLVDGNNSFTVDFGKNLWVVKPDGADLQQITGFTDATNGFPHGAVWAPGSDALVGAGRIGGVNGIWVLPLSEDRSACAGVPRRLPTVPGDAIDFVGSVFLPPPPPELFIRRDAAGVILYWRTSVVSLVLEATTALGPGAVWTPITGPYSAVGNFFEVGVPEASLLDAAFYRLRRP